MLQPKLNVFKEGIVYFIFRRKVHRKYGLSAKFKFLIKKCFLDEKLLTFPHLFSSFLRVRTCRMLARRGGRLSYRHSLLAVSTDFYKTF
jgi:hypothetical protein